MRFVMGHLEGQGIALEAWVQDRGYVSPCYHPLPLRRALVKWKDDLTGELIASDDQGYFNGGQSIHGALPGSYEHFAWIGCDGILRL